DERRWRDSAVEEIVAAAVDELVTVTEARSELIRAFLFRATQDSKIRDHALEFRRLVSARMGHLLIAQGPIASHPEPAVAVDLSVQAAFALMQQHVLYDGTYAAGRALSGAEVRRELARLVLSYVGLGGAGSGRHPDRVRGRSATQGS